MVVVETLDSGITFYRINSCKSRRDLIYKLHRSTQECWIYVSKKSFARAKASSITRDFKNNLPKKNLIVKSAQLQLAVAQEWLYLFYIHSKKMNVGIQKNYEELILENKWPFWKARWPLQVVFCWRVYQVNKIQQVKAIWPWKKGHLIKWISYS